MLLDSCLQVLEADFSIGTTLREDLVPHAVLYYTGEKDGLEGDDEVKFPFLSGLERRGAIGKPAKRIAPHVMLSSIVLFFVKGKHGLNSDEQFRWLG